MWKVGHQRIRRLTRTSSGGCARIRASPICLLRCGVRLLLLRCLEPCLPALLVVSGHWTALRFPPKTKHSQPYTAISSDRQIAKSIAAPLACRHGRAAVVFRRHQRDAADAHHAPRHGHRPRCWAAELVLTASASVPTTSVVFLSRQSTNMARKIGILPTSCIRAGGTRTRRPPSRACGVCRACSTSAPWAPVQVHVPTLLLSSGWRCSI